MSINSEVVMYIIARADLPMSPGKLAAQVGHGVHLALKQVDMNSATVKIWEHSGYTKIVLKVDSLEQLLELYEKVGSHQSALILDEGRTEIPSTYTVLGLVPMDKREAYPLVGHLKLYR